MTDAKADAKTDAKIDAMTTPMSATFESDYLVIGGGIAGLIFAIKAAETGTVTVLTKAASNEANTAYAQGGIASVWSVDDSFESHVDDTLRAGAGLCNRHAVETIVRDGPEAVRELIALGTRFTRVEEGGEDEYDLGREGGHSHRRVLHAQDLTGREIMRALGEAAAARRNIRVLENKIAVNLLIERGAARDGGSGARCWGAYVLDRASGAVDKFVARATLLATGGAGKVYLYTTNPDIASGDGVAMALSGGRADRQHGVHPVPSDLPVPSGRQVVSDLRGAARRGRDSAAARRHAVHEELPSRRRTRAARRRRPRDRFRDEAPRAGLRAARHQPSAR